MRTQDSFDLLSSRGVSWSCARAFSVQFHFHLSFQKYVLLRTSQDSTIVVSLLLVEQRVVPASDAPCLEAGAHRWAFPTAATQPKAIANPSYRLEQAQAWLLNLHLSQLHGSASHSFSCLLLTEMGHCMTVVCCHSPPPFIHRPRPCPPPQESEQSVFTFTEASAIWQEQKHFILGWESRHKQSSQVSWTSL